MKKTILLPLLFLLGLSLNTTAQVENIDIYFDGDDDYIDIPNFDIRTFTVSFWAYALSDDDGQNFFGRYYSDGSNKLVFGFYNGGLHVRIKDITYEAGEKFTGWAHLALVVERMGTNESMVSVYKNKELVWSKSYAAAVTYSSFDLPWVIGMDWDGATATDFFHGWMDEFMIYNGAMSEDWLVSNYHKTPVFSWPTLSVYYPFQGDETDISGYDRHATFHGVKLVPNSSLLVRKPNVRSIPPTEQAMVFNGSDTYLSIPNESRYNVSDEITVEFWMNTSASQATTNQIWQGLVTKGDYNWRIQMLVETGLIYWDTDGLDTMQLSSHTAVNDGKWHHIAAIYDGTKKYLFIDGQLDNSISVTGTIQNTSNQVLIGNNESVPNRYFDGAIANVRIWDWALPTGYIYQYLESTSTLDEYTLGHWQLDGSTTDFSSYENNAQIHGRIAFESTEILASNESDNSLEFPSTFSLNQNYPNPFNPATVISYQLPVSSSVKMEVFDLTGRSIATLVNGVIPAGYHEVSFDASGLSSGIYIYRIQTGSYSQTRKMMLVK